MPAGNTRHSIALSPYPVYARSGRGCIVTDVEGEDRVDFLNNFTALILGHADPAVTLAVQERVANGTAFAMPAAPDVELAELLISRVGYIDEIRFTNSGSEAVMMAIQAARAYTGRANVAKFEGAYHGTYDWAQVSEGPGAENWGLENAPASVAGRGSPDSVAAETLVLPWNDLAACRELIRGGAGSLAAVIFDPLPVGIGMIAPGPGFLEMLRDETSRAGIVLIADEVLTFRLGYHGALQECGMNPDLTCLGKIIGGGFPVGAVGGSRKVMEVFDHRKAGYVHHGGTFNANPVTMTAGLETMRQMTPEAFDRLNSLGGYLREKLTAAVRAAGRPIQVCGKGSLFVGHLSAEPLTGYRSMKGYSRTSPVYTELCHRMLKRGFLTSPRGIFGCLSTPMTEAELDGFAAAVAASLSES
jgi:glutamate-1-semialdehyde 2,1-aminomutase